MMDPAQARGIVDRALSQRGWCAQLLREMERHQADPLLVGMSIHALTPLGMGEGEPRHDRREILPAAAVIVSAMARHLDDPEIQNKGSTALVSISYGNGPEGHSAVRAAGGIGAILRAMNRYISTDDAEGVSLMALQALVVMIPDMAEACLVLDPLPQQTLEACISPVLHALKAHPRDPGVVQLGATVIKNLCDVAKTMRLRVIEEGGVSTLRSCLRTNAGTSEAAVEALLLSLACIAHGGPNDGRLAMVREGVVTEALRAAQMHRSSSEVQGYLLLLLGSVAGLRSHPKLLDGDNHGIVGAIASAMSLSPDDVRIQISACRALGHASQGGPEGRAALRGSGAMKAVVEAMRTHSLSPELQEFGSGALHNLFVEAEPGERLSDRDSLVEMCAVDVLQRARHVHGTAAADVVLELLQSG
mmetsp:Transcript_25874/g.63846  ORF Transcript_25874/g.63846 Transcript_25874/m.63846 type:complete len:418 (+) Transcript_25874:124-1377(+)|eukprot:CAMPEP_0206251406 /NCGR_PEP_ID=MMETSP0047_2-20121206/22009_1 /ASSEMBLY_ACC=CAM_ASM_000192 /TAXON_ID=195065 /ORGANISM="Chroomonas mesostigmatica_cf, Strain CCMP1168" /LENGTH=417 /DNA_ID=CAMNT_0053677361 /DNA_START=205 /DNA_END=1458 /DNA_ORIENTATION=+